jgi:ABC-type multidrug transport system permease subunit
MILDVVRTGWMNLRRDRAAMMLSFLVPIVFFSIFYGVFGAQRSGMPKVHLAIADEDRSENSKRLVAALRNESALTIVDSAKNSKTQFTAASAEDYVRAGDISIALVIPKGFGAAPIRFAGGTESGPALRLLSDSADPVAPQVVSGLLQKTVMTALLNIQTQDVVGKNRRNTVVSLYAAGIAVMFLLFTASGAGGALLEEIESGTLDRILTTRLTLTTLLLGKLAYLWTLGVSQILVMFIWGAVLFHLELLQHLPGFIIMTAATALATSAFGLLLASMSRSRAQLAALANLIVLSISALGGSMWPRFLMPPAMQKAGLALFNSWAIEGFTNVFWREEPLGSLVLPVVVLLAWAVAFFLTARRLTARWDVS